MKKFTILIVLSMIFIMPAGSQNLTSSNPAKLQVFALKPDGSQAMMNSDELSVAYDNLKMSGELILNTLQTNDILLRTLLDSASVDRISFSGVIPEGQFVFQSVDDLKFSVETDVFYGDNQSRILIDYNVSNRNTSLANTFDISCSGSISLSGDLGITRDTGLSDKISFQFFQTVQTKTY